MGGFTYGLANLFILGGWALLLVATSMSIPDRSELTVVSAPVVDHIAFLKVNNGGQTASFGTFGYCTNEAVSTQISWPKLAIN